MSNIGSGRRPTHLQSGHRSTSASTRKWLLTRNWSRKKPKPNSGFARKKKFGFYDFFEAACLSSGMVPRPNVGSKTMNDGLNQGCQISLDTIYQNGGKYTKLPLNQQTAINITQYL
jgi:hypothetical protein